MSMSARRVGLIFLAILILFLWWNAVRRAMAGPSSQFNDFIRFSRDLLFEGENVYASYEPSYTITKYPPFFAFLFAPLVPLPMAVSASFWFLMNLFLAVGSAFAAALAVMKDPARLNRRTVFLPLLFAAPLIISNLETGQVNIVIVFLLCLALLLYRGGSELPAGGVLGIAVALKLTPALFVAYFAWKRAPRVLAGVVVALGLCWGILPLVAFGPRDFAEIWGDWVNGLAPYATEGTRAEGAGSYRHTNQSLSAAVVRTLTETPAGGGRENFTPNVLALTRGAARWIVLGLSAGMLLLLAWLFRGGRTVARHPLAYGLECGLLAIAMLFLSPISWINHYVILILPFAALVAWLEARRGNALERFLRAVPWISFGLVLTSASILLQALSLPFAGAVVLAVGLIAALCSERSCRSTCTTPPATSTRPFWRDSETLRSSG